jgi:hypothetical protein
MPNRILREGILTSERVAKLGWAEEVFYRRLMSVVDDFGRYYATPMLLRAACYPLMLDKVSDADVGKWLAKCAEAALVSVYPAQDGKRYLQMVDFRQQVRAKDSKFPQMISECVAGDSTCAADAKQVPADAHLVVDVSVDEGEGRADTRKPAKGSRLPDDWTLPDDWKLEAEAIARTDGFSLNVVRESLKFRDFWLAKAGKDGSKLDWRATWRGWIRRAGEYAPKSNGAEAPVIQQGGWQ